MDWSYERGACSDVSMMNRWFFPEGKRKSGFERKCESYSVIWTEGNGGYDVPIVVKNKREKKVKGWEKAFLNYSDFNDFFHQKDRWLYINSWHWNHTAMRCELSVNSLEYLLSMEKNTPAKIAEFYTSLKSEDCPDGEFLQSIMDADLHGKKAYLLKDSWYRGYMIAMYSFDCPYESNITSDVLETIYAAIEWRDQKIDDLDPFEETCSDADLPELGDGLFQTDLGMP